MDGSTVVIAPPDGNMREYLNSLQLLKDYDIDCFAPGHGNFMDDPNKTIDSITRHRLAREAKVLRNIKSHGSQKIDDLLKHVYSDVNEVLFPIAKMSLLAHLEKLIEDKVVVFENEIYSLS
jgi:glyoxylase-like metal-dependent hydrolase (beta-lactamase superfamily II)